MYLLMQLGSKPGILQSPPPWNNTVLSVPRHRNTYTIYTSKILKFCRSVPRSIIYFEVLGPSPLASMSSSCWFSYFGSSPILGTFLYLEHLSNILLGLGNCLKETSSQVQQLLVYGHDQCAQLNFTFLTCEMHH